MNRKRSLALLPCLVALLSAPVHADSGADSVSASLDKLFSGIYSDQTPGIAVLVKKGDTVLLRKGYGMADLELGVPIEPDMVFRLGSITKQFSAVAIMDLVEEGKLRLDQTLAEMLPDYPDVYDSQVTLEHLLTHTSGIPSYTGMQEFWDQARKDHSVAEMLDYFDEKELEFTPGERWQYNNSGYFLLGAILEQVTGKTYAEVMEDRVFKPLGLGSTTYGDPTRVTPKRVEGYQFAEGSYRVAGFISMSAPYAAGSLLSTVDDLARWNDALAAIYRGEDGLISSETLKQMWTEYRLADGSETDYGFGWQLGHFQGARVVHHGGGIHGFTTHSLWLPDDDIFVAVLSNGHRQSPQMLSVQAAALAMGKPLVRRPAKVSSEVFKQYEGVYKIDDETERIVRLENGVLTTQRTGSGKLPVTPSSATDFYYEDSLTSISFELDAAGKVTGMLMKQWDQDPERAERTDKPLPTAKESIELEPEQLDRLVGQYQLMPGFVLTVRREGGKLMTQATGQPAIEIFASSPTEFFNESIGGRIVFELGEDGKATSLTLFQGGQEMPAPRID